MIEYSLVFSLLAKGLRGGYPLLLARASTPHPHPARRQSREQSNTTPCMTGSLAHSLHGLEIPLLPRAAMNRAYRLALATKLGARRSRASGHALLNAAGICRRWREARLA